MSNLKLSVEDVAGQYGLTVMDITLAWGVSRVEVDYLWRAHPSRFRIICAGIQALSK